MKSETLRKAASSGKFLSQYSFEIHVARLIRGPLDEAAHAISAIHWYPKEESPIQATHPRNHRVRSSSGKNIYSTGILNLGNLT